MTADRSMQQPPLAGSGQPLSEAASKVVPPGAMEGDQVAPGSRSDMHPGDELPPGAPGGGENICYVCDGSGRQGDRPCHQCGGTGKVIQSVAGGP